MSFLNFYECDDCGNKWTDAYECTVDDDCPECGDGPYEPYRSVDAEHAIEMEELSRPLESLIHWAQEYMETLELERAIDCDGEKRRRELLAALKKDIRTAKKAIKSSKERLK